MFNFVLKIDKKLVFEKPGRNIQKKPLATLKKLILSLNHLSTSLSFLPNYSHIRN